MAALIALIIVGSLFGFSLAPALSLRASRGIEPDPREALGAERVRLMAAIRDADLDLAMGKISAGDHAEMRRSLENEAIAVLARLEATGDGATGSGGANG